MSTPHAIAATRSALAAAEVQVFASMSRTWSTCLAMAVVVGSVAVIAPATPASAVRTSVVLDGGPVVDVGLVGQPIAPMITGQVPNADSSTRLSIEWDGLFSPMDGQFQYTPDVPLDSEGRFAIQVPQPWVGRNYRLSVATADQFVGDYSGVLLGHERIAGADRYATSIALAGERTGTPVYLASGANFPDALAAGAAAAENSGVVLLVPGDVIPPETLAKLQWLRSSRILVVGGPAVMSETVVQQASTVATTSRVAGADRFETSQWVVRTAWAGLKTAPEVYVASGWSFPDALAAVSAAHAHHAPILLVDGRGGLDFFSKILLSSLQSVKFTIIGGPAAVSSQLESDLRAFGSVRRIAGADRWATSLAVNRDAMSSNVDRVFIVSGLNFPDALSAGPTAAYYNAPIVLAKANCVPAQAILQMQAGETRWAPNSFTVVGGLSVLSPAVERLTPCE